MRSPHDGVWRRPLASKRPVALNSCARAVPTLPCRSGDLRGVAADGGAVLAQDAELVRNPGEGVAAGQRQVDHVGLPGCDAEQSLLAAAGDEHGIPLGRSGLDQFWRRAAAGSCPAMDRMTSSAWSSIALGDAGRPFGSPSTTYTYEVLVLTRLTHGW
jgi:hypothetical protein